MISLISNTEPKSILKNLFSDRPSLLTISKYCIISTNVANINTYSGKRQYFSTRNILINVYTTITTNTSPTYGLMKLSCTNKAIKTSVIRRITVAIKYLILLFINLFFDKPFCNPVVFPVTVRLKTVFIVIH